MGDGKEMTVARAQESSCSVAASPLATYGLWGLTLRSRAWVDCGAAQGFYLELRCVE